MAKTSRGHGYFFLNGCKCFNLCDSPSIEQLLHSLKWHAPSLIAIMCTAYKRALPGLLGCIGQEKTSHIPSLG